MTKATYTAPVLRAHGTVETMTKAAGGGLNLDAMFAANTPRGDLTTS